MRKFIPFLKNKIIMLILLFAMPSLMAESTDDSLYALPPPTTKSGWKASAFAGCALLAVVGGVFAICWSGGGSTHKHLKDGNGHHHGRQRDDVCPNTVTADCMAGSCIYHPANHESDCHHKETPCHGPCEIINNPPPSCSLNGGVPPF